MSWRVSDITNSSICREFNCLNFHSERYERQLSVQGRQHYIKLITTYEVRFLNFDRVKICRYYQYLARNLCRRIYMLGGRERNSFRIFEDYDLTRFALSKFCSIKKSHSFVNYVFLFLYKTNSLSQFLAFFDCILLFFYKFSSNT